MTLLFTLNALLVIPGFFFVFANLFWITFFLGMVGARYRDLEYLISSFLPLLFFISPVVFRADRLPENMNIIWLNPLSYFIEVIRKPILGEVPDAKTYVIVVGILAVGCLVTYLFYRLRGHRLSFWV